jgi:hypothetical protein
LHARHAFGLVFLAASALVEPSNAAVAGNLPPVVFSRPPSSGGPGFTAFGSHARVDFHPGGLTVRVPEPAAPRGGLALPGMPVDFAANGAVVGRAWPAQDTPQWRRVDITFGAGAPVRPIGRIRRPTVVNVYVGPESEWEVGRPTFAEVRYSAVWPGVDLVWTADGSTIRVDVDPGPGADLSGVGLRARCVGPCPTEAAGLLAAATEQGTPVTSWRAAAPAAAGEFVYVGYWGFPGDDRGLGIDVDHAGAAYATGHTFAESVSNVDAYVFKVQPGGTALDYVTILGGDGTDTSFDVAVDQDSNAYWGGATSSGDLTRPVRRGPT